MKRILTTILMVLTISVLTGCASKNEITTYNTDGKDTNMLGTQFVVIEEENLLDPFSSSNWTYRYTVYDVDSKAMYYILEGYKRSAMAPVYNADGTVKMYQEN